MNKIIKSSIYLVLLFVLASCGSKYKYETVPNDPMQARIYTLDNGLKVYMSVNKDEPMVQTYIAVKVGGKNDPAQNTGLAHYFEHLMFKGTEQFGTIDYQQEKLLLDQIEAEFERYGSKTDDAERRSIYKIIDSLSFEASKLAIPNEYDKLMAAIGSKGTNAYTSYDQTVYIENIPSNQVESWAKIQADRFENNVIRLFHTELETVYEEKNMSLTSDDEKSLNTMLSELFKNHPYGSQTILGTQEHLKNPSITKIKNYHDKWYVPNNIAICLAGDFDPDKMIKTIDNYFGAWKRNPDLKSLEFEPETPIEQPVVKEVYGLESPNVMIAWRAPKANDPQNETLNILQSIMTNGKAGLIDLNISQKQKLLYAGAMFYSLADYSVFILMGAPKEGQSLDQVRDILLAELDNLKKGNFNDELLSSIINNRKLSEMRRLESNSGRANMFVSSFVNDIPWERAVNQINYLSQVTKDGVVKLANELFTNNNYVEVRKIQQKDPNEIKISKPEITPIVTNRDSVSRFMLDIQAAAVVPIEPVFVNFSKDMSKLQAKSGLELLYKKNELNGIFNLSFIFDFGTNDNKMIGVATNYLSYLGTSSKSREEIQQKFYDLACNFSVSASSEKTYISVSGLAENMEEALKLAEEILADAQPNPNVLVELRRDILKDREDSKQNQSANFSVLQQYALYGANSPARNILSQKELNTLKDAQLIDVIKSLLTINHEILYYGPESEENIVNIINNNHNIASVLTNVEKGDRHKIQLTKGNNVLLAPYDAGQIYMMSVSNRGEKFDPELAPIIRLYNQYFGGGMNSIVFQEMREARGLAYSARAQLSSPSRLEDPYFMMTYIATQNDKMIDAITAFDDIINDMPVSENAFNIAKNSLIDNIRTTRVTKSSVLNRYLSMRELGLDYDINEKIFNGVQTITMEDLIAFQKKWVRDREYTIAVLGREKDLDIKSLGSHGTIKRLTTKEIFGY